MNRHFALVLLFASPSLAGAGLSPTYPVRDLACRADAVVLAVPAHESGLDLFVARHVYKGALKSGEVFSLGDIQMYHRPEDPIAQHQVRAVLLFLNAAEPDQPRSRKVLPSGVRCLTSNQQVWRPVQQKSSGNYLMTPEDLGWSALLDRVASDTAEINSLMRCQSLPPGSRRNQIILDWLLAHRDQFSGQTFRLENVVHEDVDDLTPHGWGDLEHLPFLWVLQSQLPADCWRAVQLYAEIHEGTCLGRSSETFASVEGRRFLMDILKSPDQLEGDRLRALRLLSSPETLNPEFKAMPWIHPVDDRERAALLDALMPFLGSPSATWRRHTAEALPTLCPPGDPACKEKVLTALAEAYERERPSSARDALAEAVRVVGGAEHWQKLTKQQDGLAAYLQDIGSNEQKLHFWLLVRPEGKTVFQQPELVLENLNPLGWVREKKKLPLPATTPLNWVKGWETSSTVHVELDVKDLQAGIWRVRVTGTAGKDRLAWSSEPRMIRIDHHDRKGPRQPGQPEKRIEIVVLNEER